MSEPAIPGLPVLNDIHQCWAELYGYVAEVAREGSDDGAAILRLMQELRPPSVSLLP